MAAILFNLVLSICVIGTTGHIFREVNDLGNSRQKRWDFQPDNPPQQWQDLVNFVNRKIEGVEQKLVEKNKRIDQLEIIISNHKTEIKRLKQGMISLEEMLSDKKVFDNKSVTRVSDLEKNGMFHSFTSESESEPKVQTHFSTSYNQTRLRKPSNAGPESNADKMSTRHHSIVESANYQNNSTVTTYVEQHFETRDGLNHPAEDITSMNRYEDSPNENNLRIQHKRVDLSSPAFHVALSGDKAVTPDVTVIYDHETLDQGNGYNTGTGIYIVPESGTYVLKWTTICDKHNYIQTLLVVNGTVRGSSWTESEEVGDRHQSTTIVVLRLNQGDRVFIRMGHRYGHGTIVTLSDYGESTFSGWKLN